MADTPEIETDRFTLRKLVRSDAAALMPTLGREEHCRYLSRPHFDTEDELADWLTDPTWDGRSWAAIGKADGTLLGRFVAIPTHDPEIAEIGYITIASHHGQGIARECTAALVDHLFAREAKRKIIAEIDAENTPSIALVERLGFTREAHFRQHERTHNGMCDVLIYGLLRDEWERPRPV